MEQTTNYHLNKFDDTDDVEEASRQALNDNADIIDAALKDASENGGIAVQDTQPTNHVLAWVDTDAQGADFCFVGSTAPPTDGSVALWVDTSQNETPLPITMESFNLTFSSDITDLQIIGENNYYNPWSNEVVIQFVIYSPSGLIPRTNNAIATIPQKYCPSSNKEVGSMAIVCKTGNFEPWIEAISTVSTGGRIGIRNFIYGDQATRVCSMHFSYIKD